MSPAEPLDEQPESSSAHGTLVAAAVPYPDAPMAPRLPTAPPEPPDAPPVEGEHEHGRWPPARKPLPPPSVRDVRGPDPRLHSHLEVRTTRRVGNAAVSCWSSAFAFAPLSASHGGRLSALPGADVAPRDAGRRRWRSIRRRRRRRSRASRRGGARRSRILGARSLHMSRRRSPCVLDATIAHQLTAAVLARLNAGHPARGSGGAPRRVPARLQEPVLDGRRL